MKVGQALGRLVKRILRTVLPADHFRRLRAGYLGEGRPGFDWDHFCSLRQLQPIRPDSGARVGLGIGRFYIDQFITECARDIRGHVLEVADRRYTMRFGGTRVVQSDVLHVKPGNSEATIVADLTAADHIPSETFDCVILTQTLQYILETRAAIRTLRRILKPGGVVLATVPGIAQITRYDMEQWGEYWRFTTLSAETLFRQEFPEVTVSSYGNVLTTIARLHGILATELRPEELNHHDRDYDVIISIRAVKAASTSSVQTP